MRQMEDFCQEALREDRAGRKRRTVSVLARVPSFPQPVLWSHQLRHPSSLFPQYPQGFYFVFYIPLSLYHTPI